MFTLPYTLSTLHCITRVLHSHHIFCYVGVTSTFRLVPSLCLALDYVGVALHAGGDCVRVTVVKSRSYQLPI